MSDDTAIVVSQIKVTWDNDYRPSSAEMVCAQDLIEELGKKYFGEWDMITDTCAGSPYDFGCFAYKHHENELEGRIDAFNEEINSSKNIERIPSLQNGMIFAELVEGEEEGDEQTA